MRIAFSAACRAFCLVICLLAATLCNAQSYEAPGKSVGDVSVRGNLVVLTLNEGALGPVNLFDLEHHTLRFLPDGTQFRIENGAEQWDGDFGSEYSGPKFELVKMRFPFSGKSWTEFSVGTTGTITFGATPSGGEPNRGPGIGRDGGLAIERFAELQEAGRELVNTTPAIAAFFKPRLSGKRYVKELEDRTVVTWILSEPFGNIPGVVPRMLPGFVGCGFRDRCTMATPECAQTIALREVDGDHRYLCRLPPGWKRTAS